jgi:vacuolar-type H+-ATPase subunit I/STV1
LGKLKSKDLLQKSEEFRILEIKWSFSSLNIGTIIGIVFAVVGVIGAFIIAGIVVSKILKQKAAEKRARKVEKCPKCGGKIIKQKISYNDEMGLEVAIVECENGHREQVILD